MRVVVACVPLFVACQKQAPPEAGPPTGPPAVRRHVDNGARWGRVSGRPWLSPNNRDIKLAEFIEGYRAIEERLSRALTLAEAGARPQRDAALRRAWAENLRDFKGWMEGLGVAPNARGLSAEVSVFLDAESRTDHAFPAAPLILGLIVQDPGCEPGDLVGRLARHPSRAVRKFALEAIGLTNRADYLPLLAETAAEPGPFASLAIRAAGRMDGGVAVLRRAVEAHPDLPFASHLVRALVRSPDADAAADLVRSLAERGHPRAIEVALQVMEHRGGLPDLEGVVLRATANRALTRGARLAAGRVLRELNPRAATLAAMNPSADANPPNRTTLWDEEELP